MQLFFSMPKLRCKIKYYHKSLDLVEPTYVVGYPLSSGTTKGQDSVHQLSCCQIRRIVYDFCRK